MSQLNDNKLDNEIILCVYSRASKVNLLLVREIKRNSTLTVRCKSLLWNSVGTHMASLRNRSISSSLFNPSCQPAIFG